MHMARPPTGPRAKDQTIHILRKTIQRGGGVFLEHKDNAVTFKDPSTGRKVCVFSDVLRSAADVRRILRERRMQGGRIQ
jgi:hypothetical protein